MLSCKLPYKNLVRSHKILTIRSCPGSGLTSFTTKLQKCIQNPRTFHCSFKQCCPIFVKKSQKEGSRETLQLKKLDRLHPRVQKFRLKCAESVRSFYCIYKLLPIKLEFNKWHQTGAKLLHSAHFLK